MNKILYQLFHPWHWLTYGQNATAVAALVAVFGLIGLVFYTLYTRRMMRMQEDTLKATITPILISQGRLEIIPTQPDFSSAAQLGFTEPRYTRYNVVINLRNIGAGAALFITGWCQLVTNKFVINNFILPRSADAQDGFPEATELLTGETTTIAFRDFKPEDSHRSWLFVVQTTDQTNGKHQLQLLRTPAQNRATMVAPGTIEITAELTIAMVHAGAKKQKTWH